MLEPRDFPLVAVFAAVVRRQSFTLAARELGMSKSAVSANVAALEDRAGVRLLERTSRRLALTQVGEQMFAAATGALEATERLGQIVEEHRQGTVGTLRITCPLDFGSRFVAPVIAALTARHPAFAVEVTADDERRDLVADRFDIAIRTGKMAESAFAQRRLLVEPEIVVATPELAGHFAHATRPRDLLGAPWVTHTSQADGTWTFERLGAGEKDDVGVRARTRVNSVAMMLVLILHGTGFGVLPSSCFADELAARRLVRVCPEWIRRELAVYALLPSKRHPPARVTLFLNALRASLAPR